jgi:DNA helicase-2/ATP-dependent DNA helicase PcrA
MKVVDLVAAADDVRLHYSRRLPFFLVADFLVTNAIKMAMFAGLASHLCNLFVFGDDDHSIFSWGGARVEHILEFEGIYPNTQLIRLEQNYRSTKTILDAANGVIAHNVGRKGKNLWTDGEVGEKLRVIASADEEAEALAVIDLVSRQVAAGVSPREIAILYRTNAQSRALEDVFKMGSMPYQIIGGVRFYERAEVRDIMAYCKAIVNPADGVSVKRIINVPRRGIGKATIDTLEGFALERNVSLIEAMHTSGAPLGTAPAGRCGAFLETFERLRRMAEIEVAPHLVGEILKETNYFKYLEEAYPDADVRTENVEEFLSVAHSYAEGSEDKSLRAFMEEVALVADVDSLDLETGQLTLMTLHNAKGLEFRTVIVTGLEEGLFPHYNSIDDGDAIEEERRLFYVGMTRARERLFVTFAGMRRRMGMMEGGIPSRFLSEIPERCLEAPLEPTTVRAASLFGGDSAGSAWSRARSVLDEYAQPEAPDEASVSQEAAPVVRRRARFDVGTRVIHDRFGKGIVRRVEGEGENTRVTVIFDAGGERKFIAQYAPMRPL